MNDSDPLAQPDYQARYDRKVTTSIGGPMLVLLCGTSFSGKSTLSRLIATDFDGEVISLDAINAERGLYGGQGIPLSEWSKTNDEAHRRVARILSHSRAAVVDDTSSPRFLRDRWRETAKASRAKFVLVYLEAAADLVIERLTTNRGQPTRLDVIDPVIREHLAGFEPPKEDEPHITVRAAAYKEAETLSAIRSGLR